MGEGAGKGDKPRPKSISQKEYEERFEQVFGKKREYWETQEHQKWVEEVEKIKNDS